MRWPRALVQALPRAYQMHYSPGMIECYAQRLLNPYRGVVHTIRYESAEAVTTDGVEWDIYVANDALLEGLGRAGRRAQISDIHYGHWSAYSGLKRGALYPSADFRRPEEMGAVVYEYLLKAHRDVPFALRDHFELWLLDARHRPLALVHSVLTETDTETDPPLDIRKWSIDHSYKRRALKLL